LVQENSDKLKIRPSDLHELLRSCSTECSLIQRELANVRANIQALQLEGSNQTNAFARVLKSGSSSFAAMQQRQKRILELSNSEQALDLRLGAVLYVHNQTLLSLRGEQEGIVKLAQGWKTSSADAVHASFLEKVLQREDAFDSHDDLDGLKSLATK
jgi:hypothetical protein